ncbi:MAG: TetR/AcrR family transcriptional regulator [Clostridiaceae bacterium]|nr:TetR/AcrR family transcriptional regulator [Clostridiaceae bacterium]
MHMTENKGKLPLRDFKFAKTRYNVLQSFLKLSATKDYEDISIEEICELAEISRGTFFNYFPSKDHVFTYYGWYFCAELNIALKNKESLNTTTYEKIKYIFQFTIEQDKKYEKLFPVFVSHILRREVNIMDDIKFTKVDLLYLFGDCEGFDTNEEVVNLPTAAEMLLKLVREGIEKGEFKPDINVRKVLLNLLSVYFSPPISYKFMREIYSLQEAYDLLLEDILEPILK